MKNINLIIFSALFFLGCGGGSNNPSDADIIAQFSDATITDIDLGTPGTYEEPTIDETPTKPENPTTDTSNSACGEQVLDPVYITWDHNRVNTIAYSVYFDSKPITQKDSYLGIAYSSVLSLELDITGYGFNTCDTIYIRITGFNRDYESEFSDEAIKLL